MQSSLNALKAFLKIVFQSHVSVLQADNIVFFQQSFLLATDLHG